MYELQWKRPEQMYWTFADKSISREEIVNVYKQMRQDDKDVDDTNIQYRLVYESIKELT